MSSRHLPRRCGGAVGYTAAIGILLVVWGVVARALQLPALPGPLPTVRALAVILYPELWTHFWISMLRVLISIAAALLIAVPLGLVMGRSPRLDALAAPIVYVTYPVPKVAFLPVIFVLVGIGDAAKVLLIFVIVLFHMMVTTRDAARGIPVQSVYSMLSLGAGALDVYRHLIFPACLPKILTSVRISLGTAIAVLFLSETVAGTTGLGYLILDAWYRAEYPEMFAGILAMSLMGMALYILLDVLEHRWCRWQFL